MKTFVSMKLMCIILSLVASVAIGQSVEELDKKAGFKEFKIGDDLSVHESKITYMKTLDNADTKLYLVKELASVKTHTGEIELEFYKGKVQEVIVSFKNSTKADYEDILKSLETLYGKSEKGKDKSPTLSRFERMQIFKGEKIILRASYDENYKLTELVYYASDSLEKLKEEF